MSADFFSLGHTYGMQQITTLILYCDIDLSQFLPVHVVWPVTDQIFILHPFKFQSYYNFSSMKNNNFPLE